MCNANFDNNKNTQKTPNNNAHSCCSSDEHKHAHIHAHDHDCQGNAILENHDSLWDEILCHMPYAIFSVAVAMVVLSFLSYSDGQVVAHTCTTPGHNHAGSCSHGDSIYYRLFHSFHFLHLLFAGTGTMLMFRRYSKKIIPGLLVGFFVPAIFCTLSDAVIPYLGGMLIGLPMQFHWCFISHWTTVLPFLLAGMLNGWAMSQHNPSRQIFYSVSFHFCHIFISSMAAILYFISFGFFNWWSMMNFVFVYIIIAVMVPCTFADIIIPMLFAKRRGKDK